MRERLIEILNNAPFGYEQLGQRFYKHILENITDYLLENGVIVPPVKIGQMVYRISFTRGTRTKYIQATTISRIAINDDGLWLFCSCNPIAKCKYGELVFLTKEEALKELECGATNE